MMNFLIKIIARLKQLFSTKSYQLNLQAIKENDHTIYCEFNDILRLDGKLIRFEIGEIAKNRNIQASIPPEALFIIGVVYGKFQHSLNEFRVKKYDIKNEIVTLENSGEKICINIGDLLADSILISQIKNTDLFKLLCPHMYKLGYKIHSDIDAKEKNSENSDVAISSDRDVVSNIVRLF